MLRKIAFASGLVLLFSVGLFTTNGCGGGSGSMYASELQGRVTDAESGAPIAGVAVWIGHSDDITDEDGQYELTSLYTATQTLHARRDGYRELAADIPLHSGMNHFDIAMRRQ
ncbi:MAG TPA: carboxypeptidase-like regulatory domain-containing protein [Thermoanaerobaculia bacterium]|nr:carboxypeptidase-like regulatory domain-containing protein [Thermoanaerobaculia bacterium]